MLLLSCSALNSQADTEYQRYIKHKKIWQSLAWEDYEYSTARQCYCLALLTKEMQIGIKDGRPVYAHLVEDNDSLNALLIKKLYSIDQWFEFIGNGFARKADHLEVEYHPEYGYPQKIEVDFRRARADDEHVVWIYEVRPR